MRRHAFSAHAAVLLRRAPDRPGEVIIKRLVALEGDWLYVPGRADVEKIPKARTSCRLAHISLAAWPRGGDHMFLCLSVTVRRVSPCGSPVP